MSFYDQLKSLKKKLKKASKSPVQKVVEQEIVEVEESCGMVAEFDLVESEPEIDILAYLDTHGTEDKDLEAQKSSKPAKNPVISSKKQVKRPTASTSENLAEFEEPGYSEAVGVEEILSFIDSHGIELKSADMSHRRTSGEENLVRSKGSTEKRIDLHGLTQREAEIVIQRVFSDAKKRGYQQLLIIHGRGNHSTGGEPLLKRMVIDLLETSLEPQVASFYFAPLNEGGGGATRVVLR